MIAEFGGGGVRVDVARRIDIAVTDPVGQRDVPRPASPERRRPRADARSVGGQRGRGDHRTIVEQVGIERHMPSAKRGLGNHSSKAAGVDEQIGLEPAAIIGDQRGDIARRRKLDRGDQCVDMNYSPGSGDFPQIAPDQHRIEMIAVAGLERKIGGLQRRQATFGEQAGHEETVGMRGDIGTVATKPGVAHQVGRGVPVEIAREGVKIMLEARLVGPSVKRNADLVGGVAARHPVGFGDPQAIEELLQLRGRPLAYPDDPDVGGFNQGNRGPSRSPGLLHQTGRHPAGGAAAQDADAGRRRSAHRAISATANPPPATMRTSIRSSRRTVRRSTIMSLPLDPISAVGPSR